MASSKGKKRSSPRSGAKPKPRSRASARPARTEREPRIPVVRQQLTGHGQDAFAFILLAIGIIATLSLVTNVTGPLGDVLSRGLTGLLGRASAIVPAACIGGAIALFGSGRNSPAEGTADEDNADEPKPWRVTIGLVLVTLGVVGLLHIAHSSPSLNPIEGLRSAGGIAGWAIGAPLAAALSSVGGAIVLVCMLSFGVLLTPGVPMRRVISAISTGWTSVVNGLRSFMDVGGTSDEADAVAEPVEPARANRSRRSAIPELEIEQVEAEPIEAIEIDEEDELDDTDELEYEEVAEDEDEEDEESGGEEINLSVPAHSDWKLPAEDILKRSQSKGHDQKLTEAAGKVLEATLHEFGVDARLIGMTVGPTVTRYELELGAGVKVNKVTTLSHDIAYAMASADVRILAPIPGRSAVGVEVPNKLRQLVTLGDILESDEAMKSVHPLEVGLGRGIDGKAVMLNLAKMPHLLIAGQTGAGKSSCINSIVTSILMRSTPDQVRMILVDPKRVELGAYNDVPHLLTPVVTVPKKAANALEWAVREMEMRYDLLADVGVRDITGYNAAYDAGDLPTKEDPDPDTGKSYDRLPFIVIVVDELNDLMMVAARDVENSICRIAQMARAVGIHLIIATQRPSVDVITGVIKANVPSRMAFAVSSLQDSRVILDQPGAEKLVGQGDMLMVTASSSKAQRVQCSWIDEDCVRKVAAHWRRQVTESRYVEGIADDAATLGGGAVDDGETDELLFAAMELVVRSGLGSTSMLQRKLRVGFSRAGRLMDLLERRGIVGPSEGSKARVVLMTQEEFEEMGERV
ncbi:MAG: DNA translocase FtsK 4TM domain-containing protein [Acidimicrobiia bacterium]